MAKRIKGLKRYVAKRIKEDNSNNLQMNLDTSEEEALYNSNLSEEKKAAAEDTGIKIKYRIFNFAFEPYTQREDIKECGDVKGFKSWFLNNHFRCIIESADRVYPDEHTEPIQELKLFSTGNIATNLYNKFKNEIKN